MEESDEDIVKIPLRNKNGVIVAYTLVDKDINDLMTFTPCLNKDGYAQAKINGITFLLHRFVMEANKGDPIVDHINNNKLDNRRINLRFVTNSQNSQNKLKKEATSSQFIGVRKKDNKWAANIKFGNKRLYKTFNIETHAAYWYDINTIKFYQTETFSPKINGLEKPSDYKEAESKIENPFSGLHLTKNNKFQVRVQHGKKNIHIGTFKTPEEAKEAYKKKKEELQAMKLQKKIGTEIKRNEDEIAIILTNKNEEILVDDDKYFDLKKYTWALNLGGYAQASIMGRMTTMHRYLLNTALSEIKIDHINRNKVDNRINNLRLVDDSLNSHNVTKRTGTSSQYIGVYKVKNKFKAEIKKDNKVYHLGRFESEIEAAQARDKKAIELYGNDANLNFK